MCAKGVFPLNLEETEPDFSYLEAFGNKDKYTFSTCFDESNFKENNLIEARITSIYDPSKFWLVTKFRELECFQKYLFKLYYMKHTSYKVTESKLTLNQYCISLVDGAYCRGVIVGFPINVSGKQEVQVFYIDYGMLETVPTDQIYYMSRECFDVPQFSVRASLEGLRPLSGNTWSRDDTMKFSALVKDKILIVKVLHVHEKKETLGVAVRENSEKSASVHELLVTEKYAAYFHDEDLSKDNALYGKLLYPHLFPRHETLESGKVPVSVHDADYEEQVATLAPILTRYMHGNDFLAAD